MSDRFTPATSQIEEEMIRVLMYLANGLWVPQKQVVTRLGTFWIDGWCDLGNRRLGFECDGEAFHLDRFRDECRDSLIISTGAVDRIYHVPGWAVKRMDIYWHCMLRELEPALFLDHFDYHLRRFAEVLDWKRAFGRGLMWCADRESQLVKSVGALANKTSWKPFSLFVEEAREKLKGD